MKTLTALILFTCAISASAQESHTFTFTGQAREAFLLTGLVGQSYAGTCYERDGGTYDDCNYDASGNYACQTVSWGSLTPYSCSQYGYFPGTGAQATSMNTIEFQSTLKNPHIALAAKLDRPTQRTIVTAQGLLPAGVVLGVKPGVQRQSADETLSSTSSVILTTNDALAQNLLSAVRRAVLDVKNKRLLLRVSGRVKATDNLAISITTTGRLFSSARDVLSLSGTFGEVKHYNQILPSALRPVGLTETELEVDVNKVLGGEVPKTLRLTLTQTLTLDEAYTWTGVIGTPQKVIKSSLRIQR